MKCNLLIVDDSAILRRAIRKTARLAGVDDDRIAEAGNGAEALEHLAAHAVDLILLDLNMPVMDGEQFAAELRKHPGIAPVPFAVVSTEVNRMRLDRMRELGAVAVLRKPFKPEDLCELITTVLGVRQS